MANDGGEAARENAKTRWVLRLWVLAGLAFVVAVLGYSSAMIYLAQRDYPGSVVNDYFENYEKFNQYAEMLENQEDLGWALDTQVNSLPVVGDELDIVVHARYADDSPIERGTVKVRLVRNINARLDRKINMQPQGDGRYTGSTSVEHPGNWTIYTTIRDGTKQYISRRYLWVEEPLK
jgi:nitrogen fixation protein FixH